MLPQFKNWIVFSVENMELKFTHEVSFLKFMVAASSQESSSLLLNLSPIPSEEFQVMGTYSFLT